MKTHYKNIYKVLKLNRFIVLAVVVCSLLSSSFAIWMAFKTKKEALNSAFAINTDGSIIPLKLVTQKENFKVEALAHLEKHKIPVFVVTNQSGIARGYFKETDMLNFNRYLREQVALKGGNILDIFYCPHHPDFPDQNNSKFCTCRKPLPGMLNMISQKWRIDLSKSIMIGDQPSDLQAGIAAGCLKSYLIKPTDSRLALSKQIILKYFVD